MHEDIAPFSVLTNSEASQHPSRCPVCGRGGFPGIIDTKENRCLEVEAEPLLTLSEIAAALQVPLFAVRRAAKNEQFPTYRVGNSRRRARLSQVVAAAESNGGEK